MSTSNSVQAISVIVPKSPFVRKELRDKSHCLAALNVEKLMNWWPGTPHTPHRKLMLEIGPLVGMIQIPGIKFGVKDVVALGLPSAKWGHCAVCCN
jgi:hypothetical protein